MFRNVLAALCLASSLLLFSLNALAINQYKVKSGNSLWGIAAETNPSSAVSIHQMIQAIKGLNLEDYPNIVNNVVRTNQTLTIPTTEQEIKDGISIYQASQTMGGYQPDLSAGQSTDSDKKSEDQSDKSLSSLERQNQRLLDENHQLRVAFKTFQDNANAEINALDKQLIAAENDTSESAAWALVIVLLILSLYLFYKTRQYRSLLNQAEYQPSQNNADKKTHSEDMVEPTLFADDSGIINANEARVEAMIKMDEGDVQGAKSCLQSALNQHPDDVDIRLKLLEVYGSEKDIVSFNSEKDYLSAHLMPHDDERWHEVDKIYETYFVNQ